MSDKIPFGLDGAVIARIDWQLALKRIIHDLRSDFIYAPHIGFIYAKAGDELIQEVRSALSNGASRIALRQCSQVDGARFHFSHPNRGHAFGNPFWLQDAVGDSFVRPH